MYRYPGTHDTQCARAIFFLLLSFSSHFRDGWEYYHLATSGEALIEVLVGQKIKETFSIIIAGE